MILFSKSGFTSGLFEDKPPPPPIIFSICNVTEAALWQSVAVRTDSVSHRVTNSLTASDSAVSVLKRRRLVFRLLDRLLPEMTPVYGDRRWAGLVGGVVVRLVADGFRGPMRKK